jgi:SpoVK/Ycf46/Vps4 family AAA+-type ATPase
MIINNYLKIYHIILIMSNNSDTNLNKIKTIGTQILNDMVIIKNKLENLEKNQKYLKKNINKLSKKVNKLTDFPSNQQEIELTPTMIICDDQQRDSKNSFEKIFKLINNIACEDQCELNKQKKPDIDNSNSEENINFSEDIFIEEKIDKKLSNFTEVSEKIQSIDDIISLGNKFKNIQNIDNKKKKHKKNIIVNNENLFFHNGKYYSVNIEKIPMIIDPLEKLNRMIGNSNIKNSILNFVMYFLQNNNNNNLLHTTIEGPPGVGKTHMGKIIAQLYSGLGVIKSNKFKLVKRTDLIGTYLGHTAHKTQQVIDEANGGVLFIDEAYSLGSTENDIYSKECIDTLNQNLTENKNKIIVIVAGYTNELDKCFFSVNPGLKRRFPFKFVITGYSADELKNIFIYKLRCNKMKLNKSSVTDLKLRDFFTLYKKQFKNFGGDIDNFVTICKFENNKRLFGKHPDLRGVLSWDDITQSFDIYNETKDKEEYSSMYT